MTYPIRYVISYLYLIYEMNKNNMKYILFLILKIKIISHSNISYFKKNKNLLYLTIFIIKKFKFYK